MRIHDFADNQRLPILLRLVSDLSKADDPTDVLRAFGQGWTELNGEMGYISLSCRGLEPGEYRITQALLHDELAKNGREIEWQPSHDLPIHTGGLLGQIVEDGKPVIIRDIQEYHDPILGDALQQYETIAAVPLYDDGKILNWSINLSHDKDRHTEKVLEDIILRSNLVGGTVKHVQTAKRLREVHQRVKDEVQKIAHIQQALLPDKLPDIPGVSLSVKYQTYDQAGGDLYSFHPLGTGVRHAIKEPDGRWAIIIGDVSGHGPSAAVVMAMVESILASYPDTPSTTGQVLDYINKHLCAKRIDDTFVTAFHALYDTNTRTLTYSRAGHPPPIWRKPTANGHVDIAELDTVGGLPLGIMADETYEDATIQLEPGQTLTLYTDGIPETRSPDGTFFGTPGIINAMRECSGEAYCAVDTIMRHVRCHEAGLRPQDDQTLVVMSILDT